MSVLAGVRESADDCRARVPAPRVLVLVLVLVHNAGVLVDERAR
ncbi:hypothetical protein [Actinophytocola sp.]